jgi:hypothetical protein
VSDWLTAEKLAPRAPVGSGELAYGECDAGTQSTWAHGEGDARPQSPWAPTSATSPSTVIHFVAEAGDPIMTPLSL